MPPVRPPFNALWHFLCPSSNQAWLTRPSRYSKSVKALFRECAKAPQRTLSATCIQKDWRPQKPQRTYKHHVLKKQSFASVPGDPHRLPGGGRLHDLTTEATYEELRRAANAGNYVRVQALVKILVRDRGERPSPRLYLALILANTNLQHGSPAEVKRLLQEMKEEGFTQESATYHAVLKVGGCGNQCEVSAYVL